MPRGFRSLAGVHGQGRVEEGLCGAWPTAGALKSVLQGWEGGRRMGTGIGRGCSPSRRAWLGGGSCLGAPVGAPPIQRH